MTTRTARAKSAAKAPAKARKKPAPAQPKRGPGGRPTKYRPEFPGLATKFCLLGATNEQLARAFDVNLGTIDLWLRTKPEFLRAVKEGREEADAKVAQALYRKATGTWTQTAVKIATKIETLPNGTVVKSEHVVPYVESFPPDTAAAFIWLKNRQPALWRDKREVHETRNESSRVTVELSPRAQQHIQELKALLFRDDQPSEQPQANGAGPGRRGEH